MSTQLLSRFASLLLAMCLIIVPSTGKAQNVPPCRAPDVPDEDHATEDDHPESLLIWHPDHVSDALIGINVTCAGLADSLRIITDDAGLSLVLTPLHITDELLSQVTCWGPSPLVTMHLRDAPFDYALGLLIESYELDYFVKPADPDSDLVLYVGYEDEFRAAFHEAGHALTAHLVGDDPIYRIILFPEGTASGCTIQAPPESRESITREHLIRNIKTELGGSVAEEIIFGGLSLGRVDDLRNLTETAELVYTEFDLTRVLSIVDWSVVDPDARVYEEAQRIVDRCYRDVKRLLRENRYKLELLATRLLEVREMDGSEVESFLNELEEAAVPDQSD